MNSLARLPQSRHATPAVQHHASSPIRRCASLHQGGMWPSFPTPYSTRGTLKASARFVTVRTSNDKAKARFEIHTKDAMDAYALECRQYLQQYEDEIDDYIRNRKESMALRRGDAMPSSSTPKQFDDTAIQDEKLKTLNELSRAKVRKLMDISAEKLRASLDREIAEYQESVNQLTFFQWLSKVDWGMLILQAIVVLLFLAAIGARALQA